MMAPWYSKRWLRPRRMLRTRIWSSMGISHALKLVAVLSHSEVTLYKVGEDSIKVKSMCLTIIEELVLQGEPQVAHETATLPNNLLKIGNDRVGEPANDNSIHPSPRKMSVKVTPSASGHARWRSWRT
jgi:hypothetical protein